MAKNFIQPGDTLELVAPAGGVVSGTGYVIGALFVVALGDAAAGELFRGKVDGVWELPKAAAVTPAQGAIAYWDDAAKTVTGASAVGLFPIGTFTAAAAGADAAAFVRLDGVATVAAAA
ncbi:MAG: DUF2190 family protein [Novosphingobium sp.]